MYNIHIKYTPFWSRAYPKNIQPPPLRLARALVKFPVCPGGSGLGGMKFLRDLQVELGDFFLAFLRVFFLLSQELLKVFEGLILLGFITKC